MTLEDARRKFHAEVVERAQSVDPEQRCDWTDLAYGYLLALGFPPGDETYLAAYKLEE